VTPTRSTEGPLCVGVAFRRRLVRLARCAVLLIVFQSTVSQAGDPTIALHELAHSSDFRVRVSAALQLGHARPAGARESLERALDDAHPAVRVAAVEALEALGDPTSETSLERRLSSETAQSVRIRIRDAIYALRARGAALGRNDDSSSHRRAVDARCLLALGSMRNGSGIRGDELRRVLSDAAQTHARGLQGVTVVVHDDLPLLRQAAARHLSVITLDGNVTQLIETQFGGTLQVHAEVEFTVRRDQTLKGTVSGSATIIGPGSAISEDARRRLQDDAVDAAVQSALRGAGEGLIVASL
jgi:HEAT repeat protein